ncbi:MAG: energy transducer TonB [Sphaerochaetaceae bacterium]
MRSRWYPIITVCVALGYIALLAFVQFPWKVTDTSDVQRIPVTLVSLEETWDPLIPPQDFSQTDPPPPMPSSPTSEPPVEPPQKILEHPVESTQSTERPSSDLEQIPVAQENNVQIAMESHTGPVLPPQPVQSMYNSPVQNAYGAFHDVQEASIAPRFPVETLRKHLEYPAVAKRQGREGLVMLELYISAQGIIEHIEVLEDPGYGMAQAAVDTFKGIVCTPAKKDGTPIAVRMRYPIRFTLR